MEYTDATPRIFISYSHDDEKWKDRVVSQLGVLEHEGLLSFWEDRQIAAGDDWLPEIETAMASCGVALLLISAKFLTSEFIRGNEVPTLLKRREQEGVRVIPVILKPCAWTRVDWLKSIQSRPKDGKALSGMSEHEADAALAALAGEVADLLARTPPLKKPNDPQVIPPLTSERTEPPAGAANFPGREAELKPVDDAHADGGNTQAEPAADRKDDSGPKPGRFTWLFSWWSSQTLLRRQILIGLLLGVSLGLGLHSLHAQLTVLRAIDDLAMDFLLRLQGSTPISQPALSFVLLDIDEQTYQAWNAPSPVPRDRLLKLIQYAVEGGAALVVVDIDLSQTGNDRNAAQQLQDYLANYGTAGKPPLLLARTFRKSPPGQPSPYWIAQRSFLEADARIVDSPLIHWGQAQFELDQDQLLRRWRLWEIGCDEHGQPVVAPAVQLLAVIMTQAAIDPQKALRRLQDELNNQLRPAYCGQSLAFKPGESFPIAGMTLNTQSEDLSQRIVYRLPTLAIARWSGLPPDSPA